MLCTVLQNKDTAVYCSSEKVMLHVVVQRRRMLHVVLQKRPCGMLCSRVHSELAQETQKTVELIDNIEKQSAHLYHAEPPIDMPFIPPNTGLAQKAGYLMIRRWVRLSGYGHALCYNGL